MHTMWKGSISFGLVNIPIKMYAAIEEKNVRFRLLHQACRAPIRTVRTCSHCGQEVPWNEVVKGFEYAEGQFVVLEEKELQALMPEKSRAIEILDFVELNEIDPIYFNKTYYLGAQDDNNKAYALLRQALKNTGKIGIAKVTIRSKQSLAVIRCVDSCLVMETIFYPDEVRDAQQVPFVPEETELSERELTMAEQLIEQLTTSFDPSQYQDEFRQSVKEAVEKKIHNEQVVEAPAKQPEKVVDLMEALQASLEATKKQKSKSKSVAKKTTRKKKVSS